MGRSRPPKEQQVSDESASEESRPSLDPSDGDNSSDDASLSEESRSVGSETNASASSNQLSEPDDRRVQRLRSKRRRPAPSAARSKRRQERTDGQFALSRNKQSTWSSRERQFDKFRSNFIVLPVPDGVTRIEKARGYSFLIKSVVSWVIPEPILSTSSDRAKHRAQNNYTKSRLSDDEGAEEDEDDDDDLLLTLGVHVSLFHAPSKRFFGNTWVSPEICIDPFQIKPGRDPKSNALRYVAENVPLNVRAYFLSDIIDAHCVGIVELVAYRKDPDSKATMVAAGCGWSILPLFAQTVSEATMSSASRVPASLSPSGSEAVGVFEGSPRMLWEMQSSSEWQTLGRHEQSKFHYQLQQYDPLVTLGTNGFVRRNELVGALEVIPGLKHGNLAGIDAGTNPKLVLLRDGGDGDNEDDGIAMYEEALSSFARMASLVPKTIVLEESFTLNIQALRVFMHMRNEVETNLISRLKLSRRTIHEGASSIDDGHVSARVLKLALHNGRCFRTRQHTIPLKVDGSGSTDGGGDDIMRCAQATPVHLRGFVFHPYMAVVVSLQFTVHFRMTWPPKLKQQAMEAKPMKVLPEDDAITVTMASRVVIPSDGNRLFLYDKEHPANNNDGIETKDRQRVLHVDLLSGPPCRPYAENPVYTPPDHVMGASRSSQAKFRESFAFADLVLMVDGEDGSKVNGKGTEGALAAKQERPAHAAEHWAKRILAKADANSVLAQTLNALATTTATSSPPPKPPASPVKVKEERGTSPVRRASPLKKKAPSNQDPVPVVSTVPTATELSRASKSLLMRYGFVDAHDTNAVSSSGKQPSSQPKKSALTEIPKSLRFELDDIYKAHEVRLHFAAFRIPPNSPLAKTTPPARVYFTFQFYRFAPTRTETLRLSNAFASASTSNGSGQTFLLMRESPANKPSLAIQYDVDTTISQNPLEHREFANYLLTKQLYVDVWDGDSLFQLGTCAIPLHELLRQGAGVKKFQGEVDVWESGSADNGSSRLNTKSDEDADAAVQFSELTDIKQPREQACTVGRLQILLSNYGLKGRNAMTSATTTKKIEKVEARKNATSASTKAKHRVRARPLVDTNAELNRLLTDQGFYGGQGSSDTTRHRQHRQLLQARNAGDATTLTPKEIDILCELFRANPQASAPHATRIACDRDGRRGLTALLSLKPPAHTTPTPTQETIPALKIGQAVPSANGERDSVAQLREHLKRVLERAMDKGIRVHQVFMDFDASGDGSLSYDELEGALGQLGVESRPEDAKAKAMMQQLLRQLDKDGNGSISYEEFLLYLGISIDQNKKEVIETTTVDMESAVREVFHRLQARGIDVEELFDHFDTDKSGSLDMQELKKALQQCLQLEPSGNDRHLLALLSEGALRALMQRVNKNGDDVVDYHEFLSFCGVVGKTPREEKMKKRALTQAERKLIKLILRAVRMDMTVKKLFKQFDSNADGDISIREFANSLDTLFQTKSSLSDEDIGAITKRFDANGDGQISYAEFKGFVDEICSAQDNLMKLFKPAVSRGDVARAADSRNLLPLAQWRSMCETWKLKSSDIDAAILWMETIDLLDDKQRVDLQEFLLVVSSAARSKVEQPAERKKEFGVRLRDYLQHAVGEGVDARRCFDHFDPDGDGEITTVELKHALRQLGEQFDDISDSAVDAMVDEIDTDGSGKISFAEFQRLLPASATATAATERTAKPEELLAWLSGLLASAVANGMNIDKCFDHFDKDKNRTITRDEFALAMQELGMENTDGGKLLTQVMDLIDRDRSGEISLDEFKRLFPQTVSSKAQTPVITPRDDVSAPVNRKGVGKTATTAARAVSSAVERLRDLLRAAERGCVSLGQSFDHFDVDKDGSVTSEEFATMIKALPGFEGVTDGEVADLVVALDANQSGSISLDEFKAFVHQDTAELKPTDVAVPVAETPPTQAAVPRMSTSTKSDSPIAASEKDTVIDAGDAKASPTATPSDPATDDKTKIATIPAAKSQEVVQGGGAGVERANKPKLQRAGSFSETKRHKETSLKAAGRANTDSDSVAAEAANGLDASASSGVPPKAAAGRRPSLAETRAAAKKAMAAKAAGTEGTPPVESAATVPEKPTEQVESKRVGPSLVEAARAEETPSVESGVATAPEKPVEQVERIGAVRRPSLAEARAAAKAAKAAAQQTAVETGEVAIAKATQAAKDSGVRVATSPEVGPVGDSQPTVKPVLDKKTNEGAAADEALGPAADVVPSATQEAPQPSTQRGTGSRRPSLADPRAAARAAAKTRAGPTEKPPTAGSARRPSLAEARAAAAAAAKGKPEALTPAPAAESPETQRALQCLQSLLQQALESGKVDLPTALNHFDKDENGKLSYEEFSTGLKTLGSDLTDISPDTARAMARWIDITGKDHITLQDFEVFVQTPLNTSATSEKTKPKDLDATTAPTAKPDPSKPRSGSLSARVPPRTTKQAASKSAASALEARSMTARTESVRFKQPTVNEPATKTAAPPSTKASTVSAPAPDVCQKDASPRKVDGRTEAPPSDYDCSYEFNSDPAIRSVEVKLRRAAIDAYSRGVFPLRLVHRFLDSSTTSAGATKAKTDRSELRRVEFLQLLMEMGFSLLSSANDENAEDDGDADTSAGPRMHDQLYARQLERLARYKHHIKEESRAEKALVRAVHHMQARAKKQSKPTVAAAAPLNSVNRFVQDKSQLMRVLSYYRDGHKKSLVYSLLRDQVTTQVALFPSFAALVFAEMPFVNPYPHQERFRLEFLTTPATVDADVVKNSDEWRFYRRHVPLAYGDVPSSESAENVEHDMIDPHNEVVLDANDQIAIPIKLRWLQPTTTTAPNPSKASATMSLAVRSCLHGHTVALFKLELFAQPFACHRVLRFVSPANSVWKWTVRCPQRKHLVCLDPSVAAVIESSGTGNATLVTLKCRVGAYPSLEDFFVVVYDDEYFARIDEVWQIRIQAAMRLDVHTLLGQTMCSELVLRGDGHRNRHVRCFTTWHHATHVSFRPAQIFQLVADAYNRIEWRFCATELPAPSLCCVRVHLVDVETHELVGSWLLHVSLGRPTITKSYELQLPTAHAAQKKIAYTNPWDQAQSIVLRSSDSARMRPRDSVLQIPPQGQIFLRLLFPVPPQRDERDVLLFVNDQQTEQNEECLRFQVSYTPNA